MLKNNFIYKTIKKYIYGQRMLTDPIFIEIEEKSKEESNKKPSRTEIINYLLSLKKDRTIYLEIGVRNPDDNYNSIKADEKYSVDPGVEFDSNPVDFKMTSDMFFQSLDENKVLNKDIRFDVIFIDGLHLAEQVDRDIANSLKYIKDDGFIVLHDCNPPSEWHARENYNYIHTPAKGFWNGTTWKAFMKWRFSNLVYSCCINSDWGVGILSKKNKIGESIEPTNPFFEFAVFDKNRAEHLNLIEFDDLKKIIESQ